MLWLQGCTLGCRGCFNPATHNPGGGMEQSIAWLADLICRNPGIEGLTVSGGEPLQQIEPLSRLLEMVKSRTQFSVILFTGYEWEELVTLPGSQAVLRWIDLLFTGRYKSTGNHHAFPNGSKKIHFLTSRYNQADLDDTAQSEIVITTTGELRLSGIEPIAW